MKELTINESKFKKMKKRIQKSLDVCGFKINQSELSEILSKSLGFKNEHEIQNFFSKQKIKNEKNDERFLNFLISRIYDEPELISVYNANENGHYALYVSQNGEDVKVADVIEKDHDDIKNDGFLNYQEENFDAFSKKLNNNERLFYIEFLNKDELYSHARKEVYKKINFKNIRVEDADLEKVKKSVANKISERFTLNKIEYKNLAIISLLADGSFYCSQRQPMTISVANKVTKKFKKISIPEYNYEKSHQYALIQSIIDNINLGNPRG